MFLMDVMIFHAGQLQTDIESELKGLLQTVNVCQSQLPDHPHPSKVGV